MMHARTHAAGVAPSSGSGVWALLSHVRFAEQGGGCGSDAWYACPSGKAMESNLVLMIHEASLRYFTKVRVLSQMGAS